MLTVPPSAWAQGKPEDGVATSAQPPPTTQPASSPAKTDVAKPAAKEPADWFSILKNIPIGPGKLDIGGGVRSRYEYMNNYDVRRFGTNRDDELLLLRSRLNLDYKITGQQLHFFVEAQDARYWLTALERSDFPATNPHMNQIDLRQAYVEWKKIGNTPFGFKVGRQSISYADNRIFGPGEWGNTGRYQWDAAKLYFHTDAVDVDMLYGRQVETFPTSFDDEHFDYDMMGVYAQIKKLPMKLDVFYLLRYDDAGTTKGEHGLGDRRTHTMGFCFDGTLGPRKEWDYGGTVAFQAGEFGQDEICAYGLNSRLDVRTTDVQLLSKLSPRRTPMTVSTRWALAGLLALTASAVFPLAGCRKEQTGSPKPSSASAPILRVGHVGHDHHLALYVAALESARLEKAGGPFLREVQAGEVYDLVQAGAVLARLRLLKVDGGAGMPAAMARGEIDVGLGGVAAIVKFADDGQPIRIIAPLQTDGDMLVMRKDSPAHDWASFVQAAKASPRPLKIGYKAPIACAKMIFEVALKAEGIPVGLDASDPGTKVVLVNLGSEKSPLPMLESGSIDGFVMNQPAPAVAVHKGLGKAVADLRDLPPKGRWIDHPCCCVAAMKPTIQAHPKPLQAFLQVLMLSTELIRSDQALAIDCAVRWTRMDKQVEQVSIPTVGYVSEPTEAWLTGMTTWAEMVQRVGFFKGAYASRSPSEIVRDVCSLDLCRAAAAELRAKGRIQ